MLFHLTFMNKEKRTRPGPQIDSTKMTAALAATLTAFQTNQQLSGLLAFIRLNDDIPYWLSMRHEYCPEIAILIHYFTCAIVPITLPPGFKSLDRRSYGGLTKSCWLEGMSILLRCIASRVWWLTTTAPEHHSQLTGATAGAGQISPMNIRCRI
jgi:hypothetical protein